MSDDPGHTRDVFVAATVVPDPVRVSQDHDVIDWETTLGERRRIWSCGLGVAEAMDTAQRGQALSWPHARRLIEASLQARAEVDGEMVVGISTDQLADPVREPGRVPKSLIAVADAYLEQLELVESLNGRAVVMPSRQLHSLATSADDYRIVYDTVIKSARYPVLLHWLGPAFDPFLAGYWGSDDAVAAQRTVSEIMTDHPGRIRGVKVSLLDYERERAIRASLPPGVVAFTGDDFNYVDLIAPDEHGTYSHALLGAFAMFPEVAAKALSHLGDGDLDRYRDVLGPTQQLSRLVFTTPTQFYKCGITWLSYLDGRRSHFTMLGGLQAARPLAHLGAVYQVAADIELFTDPDQARDRLDRYLAVHGLNLTDLPALNR